MESEQSRPQEAHPTDISRPCLAGQQAPSDDISGSVMAALDYHRKHSIVDSDCGHPTRRARSNTVPTVLLRRLRNGAEAEPTSVHAIPVRHVERHGRSDRRPSLDALTSLGSAKQHSTKTTRQDEIVISHMNQDQQDNMFLRRRRATESALTVRSVLTSATVEVSAVAMLDQCMDAADDEFYTVYRDPLPRGSIDFEKVGMYFKHSARVRRLEICCFILCRFCATVILYRLFRNGTAHVPILLACANKQFHHCFASVLFLFLFMHFHLLILYPMLVPSHGSAVKPIGLLLHCALFATSSSLSARLSPLLSYTLNSILCLSSTLFSFPVLPNVVLFSSAHSCTI